MGLNILTRTTTNSRFPVPPRAVKDGFKSIGASAIPHGGTLIDEVVIGVSSITGNLTTATTATVWTVNDTDLNAAVDNFLGRGHSSWYDSINDRMYVFGVDTGTTPDTVYTAYITLETGAVTNVGNAQFGTQPAGNMAAFALCAVNRTSEDSGNFTLYFKDRTVVINESTGAEVSNVAAAKNADPGSYISADGSTFVQTISSVVTNDSYMTVLHPDRLEEVPIPMWTIMGDGATTAQVMPWGLNVKIVATTNTIRGLQTFKRTEFDAWLLELLDYAGIE